MKTINYQSLSSVVTTKDIREYLRKSGTPTLLGVGVLFVFLVLILVFGPIPALMSSLESGRGVSGGAIVTILIMLAGFGGICWAIYISTRQTIRISRFANDNGFDFRTNIKNPAYSGMIFDHGSSRVLLTSLVSGGEHGKDIEFGNYQYVIGSGKNRRSVNYGFVRIKLTRHLPHLVLDAKRNNLFGKFSNLPNMYSSSQRLSLEGDFDNHFSLFAPKQYERDALYVMTPDIMAALIDGAKAYDLEIVDNQLFIYSSVFFPLHKQETLQRLFSMTNTIAKELDEQTDFYADERVGDRTANIVADPGRRLKKGVNWVVVLVIAYFLISFLLHLAGIGSFLFSN